MSPAVPLPVVSDRRSFVVIIGVDPHKRTHTASALEPGSHRVLATVQIEATLAGYRQLARWAARFEVRRWAVENARGLGRHLAQWLTARGNRAMTCPPLRPPGCGSCPAGVAARTTSSTRPRLRAWPRWPATPRRSRSRTCPRCWRCLDERRANL